MRSTLLAEEVGPALKHIRERRERKQSIVAELAGITPGMLSRYELGQTCPKLETLDRLLAVLGCTLEEFSRMLRAQTRT